MVVLLKFPLARKTYITLFDCAKTKAIATSFSSSARQGKEGTIAGVMLIAIIRRLINSIIME